MLTTDLPTRSQRGRHLTPQSELPGRQGRWGPTGHRPKVSFSTTVVSQGSRGLESTPDSTGPSVRHCLVSGPANIWIGSRKRGVVSVGPNLFSTGRVFSSSGVTGTGSKSSILIPESSSGWEGTRSSVKRVRSSSRHLPCVRNSATIQSHT